MPTSDWQFWLVTLVALAAAVVVVRKLAPPNWLPRMLRRPTGRKATLTVKGKSVDQR